MVPFPNCPYELLLALDHNYPLLSITRLCSKFPTDISFILKSNFIFAGPQFLKLPVAKSVTPSSNVSLLPPQEYKLPSLSIAKLCWSPAEIFENSIVIENSTSFDFLLFPALTKAITYALYVPNARFSILLLSYFVTLLL